MTTEHKTRRKIAVAEIVIGLTMPVIFLMSYANFSYVTSSVGRIAYSLIFPLVCFILLAALAMLRIKNRFWVTIPGIVGATIAACTIYLIPTIFFSIPYTGGGHNFGIALLAALAPGAVPIFMFLGLIIGESYAQKRAPNPAFKRDSPRSGRAP
jgi:hypothetical protein